MIDRNVKKSLQLRRVQIHDQGSIGARCRKQISHELRRYRYPRLVLAVLPGISKVRNYRGDAPGRGPLERIDHQQQLHQVLVHRMAGGLEHEYIRPSNVLLNLNVGLAVAEASDQRLASRQSEEGADFIAQR